MAQQTAVEWLVDYIKNLEKYPYKTIQELEEQAKQMEKEQIVEAWNDGNFLGRNGNILADYSDGNRYYKKEFENK
jgi:hypothetical protein